MTREHKIAMLRLAKELTGHNELTNLIETSKKLDQYLDQDTEIKPISSSLREFINSGVMIPHIRGYPFDKEFVPYVPHDYLLDMADKLCEPQSQAVISSLHLGIDLMVNLYILWTAMSKSNQSIMVMNTPQSQACLDLVNIYELWTNYTGAKTFCSMEGKNTIRFDNGSMIIGKAAKGVIGRGTTLTHLVFHNAASISYSEADELDLALQPMLCNGGKILVTGLPAEPVGYFYNAVQSGKFEVLRYPWYVHPDRDVEWEKMIRNGMSEREWRREYECEFVGRQ